MTIVLRIMLAALLLAVSTARAQTAADLERQGVSAYAAGKYAEAITLFERAAALPEDSASPRAATYYNLACCHALLEQTEEAFAALDKAFDAGYTDCRWLGRDRDLEILRRDHAGRLEQTLKRCQAARAAELINRPPLAVLAYDADFSGFDVQRLAWDDPDGPELTRLRETYKLDSIAGPGEAELERILRVMDWVSRQWEHDGSNECRELNALAILQAAAAGERFRCVEYAVVLANCLTALGYPARVVGLQREGLAFGLGKGHVVAEVWCNEFAKWIVLDPQNNALWQASGRPLGAAECRDYFLSRREDELEFAGRTAGWNYAILRPEWIVYFHHLVFADDNRSFARAADDRYELLAPGVMPELFFQGAPWSVRYTTDAAQAYPPLNQVRIRLQHVNPDAPADTLRVVLEHTMPWFDRYVVNRNGQTGELRAGEFDCPLIPGDNVLEVRAVNRRGVEGPPARLVLRNNLHSR